MSEKGPHARIFESIPESAKRLGRFLTKPSIPEDPIEKTEMSYAYIDFAAALAAVSGIIAVLKYLLPEYLEINPVSLINWHILVLLLFINTVLFSLILYVLLAIPLALKESKSHSKIYYQSIKAFAVENILIAIMVTVAINRIIVKGSLGSSTGTLDLWIGIIAAFGSLSLIVWLVAIPVTTYMKQYYSKPLAYTFAYGAILITTVINPALPVKYFNHIIDPKEFCSQYVAYKFKGKFSDCTYNQDCLNRKCVAEIDRLMQP